MTRLRAKLTYANTMVTLLTFVVLGGSAYAATQLPKNSVGTQQLKNGAVTKAKLAPEAKPAAPVAQVGPQGASGAPGPAGAPGAAGVQGSTGLEGVEGKPGSGAGAPGILPAGTTLRGFTGPGNACNSAGCAQGAREAVSFYGYQLSTPPVVHVIPIGGPSTTACPGSVAAPSALAGDLCIYLSYVYGTNSELIIQDETETNGLNFNVMTAASIQIGNGKVSPFGFTISYHIHSSVNVVEMDAIWAVTG
jgi:hypothetical protein